MWRIQHETTAGVSPDRIWRLWSDVSTWKDWNPDVSACTIDGAFASGSTIRMTLADGSTVPLTLAEVSEGRSFTDRAEIDGIVLTTRHSVREVEDRQLITYALQVDGAAPEPVLAEIGTAVSGDWPETLAGLVAAAGG